MRAPAWHLQPLQSSRGRRGAEPTLGETRGGANAAGDEGRSQRWPVTSRLKFESLVTVSLRRLFTRGQGRDLAAARCLGERRARGSPWFGAALGAASSLFSERHTPAEGPVYTDPSLIPLPATGESSQAGVSKRHPRGQRPTRWERGPEPPLTPEFCYSM